MKTIACLILSGVLLTAQTPLRTPMMSDAGGTNLPIQKVGANDLISVSVYDAPELTRTVRVSADGFIRLPMLKQRIKAEGLMPTDLETRIAAALKAEKLIVDPFVTVTVAEYASRPISVMGAVRKPITFQAIGQVTLLDALARAEGLSQDAGTEILLTHSAANGETSPGLIQRIAVKDLIDAANPAVNIKLTGGEEIRVPEAGKIFVVGNVKKPGAFGMKDNGEISVLKAVALAEGVLPYSSKQAYIYRREGAPGQKNEIPIELGKILARKSPDVAILPNDVLYIPDAKGTRAGLAALEKVLMFGSGATSALIYAGVR
jgi:polysaccharide export outer membrane protein